MTEPAVARIAGQLDVDEVFELVTREQEPAPAGGVRGGPVGGARPGRRAFVATLADAEQTQRTYRQACARFLGWLGPDARAKALMLHTLAAYQAELARSVRPLSRHARATPTAAPRSAPTYAVPFGACSLLGPAQPATAGGPLSVRRTPRCPTGGRCEAAC